MAHCHDHNMQIIQFRITNCRFLPSIVFRSLRGLGLYQCTIWEKVTSLSVCLDVHRTWSTGIEEHEITGY